MALPVDVDDAQQEQARRPVLGMTTQKRYSVQRANNVDVAPFSPAVQPVAVHSATNSSSAIASPAKTLNPNAPAYVAADQAAYLQEQILRQQVKRTNNLQLFF